MKKPFCLSAKKLFFCSPNKRIIESYQYILTQIGIEEIILLLREKYILVLAGKINDIKRLSESQSEDSNANSSGCLLLL
jgi:hypothetical protein